MKVRIQEPWWSAYTKFGWSKGIWGIGFDKGKVLKAIKNKEKVDITINKFKEKFQMSPVTIRNLAEKNNWKYRARFNTLLYVIPNTKLKKA